MRKPQVRFGLAEDVVETIHFRGKNASAQAGHTVVATPGVFVAASAARFLDQPLGHHFLEVVIKRSGADFVLALGVLGDFLHNGVAVKIFSGQGEQDMKNGRGKRKKGGG